MHFQILKDQTTFHDSWMRQVLIVIFSSIFIALFAPIAIPLPFTPVPIALQPHLVLLMALFLGSKRGVATVFSYVTQGALGFPVFAGGVAGLANVLGPRGGYLLGYFFAAYLVGYLAERKKELSVRDCVKLMALGNGVIYLTALPWLAKFTGWENVLFFGFYPFIPGDILKILFLVGATFKSGARNIMNALR